MSMLHKFSYKLYVVHEKTDCDFEEHVGEMGSEIHYIIGLYYKKMPENVEKKKQKSTRRRSKAVKQLTPKFSFDD